MPTLSSTPSATTTDGAAASADLRALLAAVAEIAPLLQAEADRSDREGRLSPRSVEALRSNDLWRMRLCRERGGLELSITDQIAVLAALAEVDTSSAWCTMVANDSVGVLGATMPDATLDHLFADGVPTCSIVAAAGGKAVREDGGYRLTGTWRLASGIHHATWVLVPALADGDPSRLLTLAVPVADVEVQDSWNVVGLSGSGSSDFTADGCFLPDVLAGREGNPYGQLRGERRYDLIGFDRVESYEHLAFAIGVSRRALRELRHNLAVMPSGRHTADREVVHDQLARAALELHAIEALTATTYARIDAAATGDTAAWDQLDVHLPRALAVRATESALDCVQLAFRRTGAPAVRSPNVLDKLVRDMSVAATHAMVDDTAVARFGQHLLETDDLRTAPAAPFGSSRAR